MWVPGVLLRLLRRNFLAAMAVVPGFEIMGLIFLRPLAVVAEVPRVQVLVVLLAAAALKSMRARHQHPMMVAQIMLAREILAVEGWSDAPLAAVAGRAQPAAIAVAQILAE